MTKKKATKNKWTEILFCECTLYPCISMCLLWMWWFVWWQAMTIFNWKTWVLFASFTHAEASFFVRRKRKSWTKKCCISIWSTLMTDITHNLGNEMRTKQRQNAHTSKEYIKAIIRIAWEQCTFKAPACRNCIAYDMRFVPSTARTCLFLLMRCDQWEVNDFNNDILSYCLLISFISRCLQAYLWHTFYAGTQTHAARKWINNENDDDDDGNVWSRWKMMLKFN